MNKMIGVMLLVMSLPVLAHPGLDHHGGVWDGVVHFLGSIDHWLPLLLLVYAVRLYWYWRARAADYD